MSEPTGDCYEAAAKYIMDKVLAFWVENPQHQLRLVHGEVRGQGPLEGQRLGHAWVEDGDTVIDVSNGRDLRMPKELYYAIGNIDDIGNTHVYTPEEARRKILQSKTWGPWDLVIEENEREEAK